MEAETSRSQTRVLTRTCPSCKLTVNQVPGTTRTMCPGCGSFYDEDAARQLAVAQNNKNGGTNLRRQIQARDSEELPAVQEKKSGPIGSLANFFSKLGKKKQPVPVATGGPNQLPPIQSGSGGGQQLVTSPRPPGYSSLSPSPNPPPQPPSREGSQPKRASGYATKHAFSCQQLSSLYGAAKKSKDYEALNNFFVETFSSIASLNDTFKRDPSRDYGTAADCGLQFDLLSLAHSILVNLTLETQKAVLKQVISCLLADVKSGNRDAIRAYAILIMNPLFSNVTTYTIFAHLLRKLSNMTNADCNMTAQWLKLFPADDLKKAVVKINKCISCRLDPTSSKDLPIMSRCQWWVGAAIKTLALFNGANGMNAVPKLDVEVFYNPTLDKADLFGDYSEWRSAQPSHEFLFCKYPFVLTIKAKRFIMQKDSEEQMLVQARRSLVAKVQQRKEPKMGMLFLSLKVRRSHIVPDSLAEIEKKQKDLKKKLKVTFTGEAGLDLGGLTKEWFLLLVRKLFQPEYKMFVYNEKSNAYWFSLEGDVKKQNEFHLMGVLMGLAVYNSINLDIRFPPFVYKKLLSPAVVPASQHADVGVTRLTLQDMAQAFPEVAASLQELLNYDGDVEEDFCLTHQVSIGQFGRTYTHNLLPKGDKVAVNNQNRYKFVDLYVEWLLNEAVYAQFRAFYHGFHCVCASNALLLLQPTEVEILVCGSPDLDMSKLEGTVVYDGYRPTDPNIKHFWSIVQSMSEEMQKKLLLFCTGSDRVPVGGMEEMAFKITKTTKLDRLPVSHTCFNQLILPAYSDKEKMERLLMLAVQNTEGFGLE